MKNIEWSKLTFGYSKTDYNIRCYYRDGKWGELEISSSENIPLHMAATSLHYGQEAFEGLKAFCGKDNKIRVFRWEENHQRMVNSAQGILMPEVPKEIFWGACKKVIELNRDYVPPYGHGASFYLRPLLIGTGAQVGVKAANEYLFMVFGVPVGPYFKEGFKPVNIQIVRDADRAAPLGTGVYKVGGNYAASLSSGERAHKEGFSAALYLDAKEKKYIDECGPANFFGIKNNTYVTPLSTSILPSITNKSLMVLAEDMGLKVERRPIPVTELSEFSECGACGTAAVISPIGKIVDSQNDGKEYVFSKDGKAGSISTQLYERLLGIQYGEMEDKFKWNTLVD
ncbi:MAG TPA: branched chain amino acid aminotransferase [Marinilabiliales bacterium]|nr:MAG: branched chain amino acid aminotransferase [Bacteroidetes bacterium GWA2_40_14]OFX58340.1 MAG: branched chain amino acid aminotransferase [Bacteroidetes bacterium GWC2_40_13]OFX88628.1 MAG: branched chain amino acid aminotransferase [Bacteroidetes bacterium GWE2_40_63]OFY19161.1 MAG: branched chain amino acid aminotransferase [Bacteroidetes bacterium GWF2_40_13]OFZ30955.1 MAG: branched chain amino acid aminotransferase [Bacteroidetes bacterium RIFOXYC2_FULL_40_12]HAM98736.1 branched ch